MVFPFIEKYALLLTSSSTSEVKAIPLYSFVSWIKLKYYLISLNCKRKFVAKIDYNTLIYEVVVRKILNWKKLRIYLEIKQFVWAIFK